MTDAASPRTSRTENEVVDKVRHFIAAAMDEPVDTIEPDDDLYEKHGLDSLGATLVVVDICFEFDLLDPEDELIRMLRTARQFADWAQRCSAATGTS